MLTEKTKELLQHQHYHLVGEHSAVKLCHWLKKSLRDNGHCYKQQFYHIQSHRCLQMTPAVNWCNHNCLYCWRKTELVGRGEIEGKIDDPHFIIDESEKAQRVLMSGFGGAPETLNHKKYKQAQQPNQVAISLSGEPFLYPKLDELIDAFKQRKYSVYLVTNGTFPQKISSLNSLPTNFYVSIDAPSQDIYKKLSVPVIKEGWGRIKESLKLMEEMDNTTVCRLTMVDGWNMIDPAGYANLINLAQPEFVEVKAYMFVGDSRQKMTLENMPSHEKVRDFAQKLADELGYKIKDEKKDSRVVLIAKS